MRYIGSKRRIWQYIAPIILKDRGKDTLYVEPMCGGCNSLSQVGGRRLAADNNPYLISMFKSLLSGEEQIYPIPRELYNEVRSDYRKEDYSRYSKADMGWVGFMASYNGRFFDGGYSGNNSKVNGGTRDYIDEKIRDVFSQLDGLKGVDFRCCSFGDLDIPSGSIIYCDPPYKDTTEYTTGGFDYDYFYYWCEKMSKAGNKVFISEYWMPPFFEEVWSMEVHCNINVEKNKRVEKLFTI